MDLIPDISVRYLFMLLFLFCLALVGFGVFLGWLLWG